MINLRPYQIDAIKQIKNTFKKECRQYVEMPTGSGKTVTFLSYAIENHKKVLVIVPSKELMKQVSESALLFYEPWEITRKGDRYNEKANNIESWEIEKYKGYNNVPRIHICIINSIRGKYLEYLSNEEFDLTIIDEAHHSQSDSYKRFIELQSYNLPNIKILGVTATPDRIDGQLIEDILHNCSFRLTIEELIEEKHLSNIEGFCIKTKIDINDIHDHNGDFSLKQLYKRLCIESRNQMIIDICKKEMKNRKTLIFCINIAHSKQINKLLNDNKIPSRHIDGKMNDKERNSILNSFRNGEISCLCNCQLLTEGFDEPSIDGIVLARPTRSKALFTQMIGRGLRIFPGKENCKIVDVVDNHKCLAGFNCLVEDEKYPEIQSFKSIKDIKNYVNQEKFKVTEFHIERINLFNYGEIENVNATDSMTRYLEENNIYYQQPISFHEACFLQWYNELKKEYANG